MADLTFSRPRHAGGPVHLVFGAGPVVVVPDPVTVTGTTVLGGISSTGLATYDNRNPRRAGTSAALPHQTGARALGQLATAWGLSTREIGATRSPWGLGAAVLAPGRTDWRLSRTTGADAAAPWARAQQRTVDRILVHHTALRRINEALAEWQAAQRIGVQAALVHQAARLLMRQPRALWQTATHRQWLAVARHRIGTHRAVDLLAPWETGQPVPPGREVWPPVNPYPFVSHVPNTHLVFGHVCNAVPALVAIPVRNYYMAINSIALRRVVGNIALDAHAFNMTLDADSWTWRWNATLDRSAEAALQPDVAGQPVELEAVVNGVPYRLLVGRVGQSTQFPRTRFTVSGQGLAGVLAEPHAPVATYSSTVDLTAQQLMEQVLTVNGQSIGWGLDWGLTDWLVPGNAWTFQGTPIEALVDIAGAAGGYLQPHATAQTLRVLPRYPTAPWEWASVVPDVQLPGSAVEVQSMDWVDRPGYNGVFVGGIGAGVFGPVTRAGTVGDVLAPQVTHQLITDADAHRQRGLAVLADTGRQVHMSLKLQVLPETGLILPGQMVRYVAGQTRVGIVRSVALDWSSPVMRQTIGVESHAA